MIRLFLKNVIRDIGWVTIILVGLLIFVSTGWGQTKIIESNKFEFCLGEKSNFVLHHPQLKFTVSDSWFGRDKVHHFLTSAFLSSTGYYFFHEEQNFSNVKSQQGGFCFSVSLGLMKELRDGFKANNAFSVKDLIADILGAVVGIALVSDL